MCGGGGEGPGGPGGTLEYPHGPKLEKNQAISESISYHCINALCTGFAHLFVFVCFICLVQRPEVLSTRLREELI